MKDYPKDTAPPKNWRPEGWKYGNWLEDEKRLRNPSVITSERLYNSFEAGADAMLEALRQKQGIKYDLRNDDFCHIEFDLVATGDIGLTGKMVCIPDDDIDTFDGEISAFRVNSAPMLGEEDPKKPL